ncbi:MAG: hypothetical protein AAGJ31_05550, partial [Verrucomicrobiota bacterium]
MSQENQEGPEEPRNRGEGGGFNWRGVILLLIAFLLFGLAFFPMSGKLDGERLAYYQFKDLLSKGKIIADEQRLLKIVDSEGEKKSYIKGYYEKVGDDGVPVDTRFFTVVNLQFAKDDLWEQLYNTKSAAGGSVTNSDGSEALTTAGRPLSSYLDFDTKNNFLPTLLVSFLPILVLLAILYFLFRHQMKMAGRGAMSFGKSKAKLMALDKNKVTFKNVAGVQEAKEEV